MDKIRLPVDFNEMIDYDMVMLSQTDTKTDCLGNMVTLYEGMSVIVYEEDRYSDGDIEYLFAEGVVIRHDLARYPVFPHVKWFCQINANGIQNCSEDW